MNADSISTGLAPGALSLLSGELTRRIIRVFYDVYNELGCNYTEVVYQRALAIALSEAGLRCQRERSVEVQFRGRIVGSFRPDLVVEDAVLLELKAVDALVPVHEAQIVNYLRATRFETGLLFNFGPRPSFRRLILSSARKH